jgi:hypothetical protein
VVGGAATPSGAGYWLVAADGGVFTYGDAAFHGSAGGLPLNAPVVGIVPTAGGGGYRLVAADGGLFAYGDAAFHGSAGGLPLVAPVVGAAATPSGGGYWMVARDGGVFSFGDAAFHGTPATPAPVVGLAAAPAGGYWVADADGGVHSFGPAPFSGSAAGACLDQPVAGIAADPDGVGYWLLTRPVPVPQPAPGASPLAALAQQSTDVAARLRLRQACQAGGGRVTLLTPVAGARRSQAFGPRIHPVFGVPQVHTGLDLAAPAGTAIRAPADGVVVDVALRVGYGWATMIDHGGRVATLLAHQSSVAVAPGQAVARGQVVGRVGSTGYATGPHLHLEVRVGGDPVDPAPWL